ncbi:MAG: aminoacetone oxidase family FAD-binding enzyme [Bacteroidales bacterium]|nr:aminoacetone oxidase family FAD-binding enzyme [Lachnoclostridium sp.]MCM1383055.1 aminoacetone oxidase family FAD-binding enzyme [Lachnoclostridium sp.]MCM1463890.1 aminoacetone oxidase family FAD-binding enzyme [Bacteroidales bacterium]
MGQRKIGIIGGGASGMAAAVTAAGQGANVTILEGNDRMGKKLLATGNGRCNLGNLELSADCYFGEDIAFVADRLAGFNTQDTVSFFRELGLMIKSKNNYLYPACEQASAVLDVLRIKIKELGITVKTECKICRIAQKDNGILVSDGREEYVFDRVIIACGGKAAKNTGSDGSGYLLAEQLGHSLIPTVPALVALRCKEDYFKSVAGVRADANITLEQESGEPVKERGELQLTDYGISGIPIFQLSRIAGRHLMRQKEVTVHIDLLPDYTGEDLKRLYETRILLAGDKTVEEFFTGMLHKKIMLLFVRLAGLKAGTPVKEAAKDKIWKVFSLCKDWKVTVVSSNPYENAQVCAGGVPTGEVTEKLESRKIPGVYFAGEVLDVDGKCGGYNLQWAWCSGYLAGRAAAE